VWSKAKLFARRVCRRFDPHIEGHQGVAGGALRGLPRPGRSGRLAPAGRDDGRDPPHRIVEAVTFVTTDPAFFGEMTLTTTFEEVSGGTAVTLVFENLPPGLRAEDNEAGSRLSLEQLARRFE
jgi:hypothetical protein